MERYAEAYRHEIDDFVDAWKQQRAPLAGADDGLQALRLAEAAERSRHEGRRITLDEID
nr:Gfo/Idh/MocA family oxidoreductase [Halomonas elongata]